MGKIDFVLLGRAGDVFKELHFLALLESKLGYILHQYCPVLEKNGRN